MLGPVWFTLPDGREIQPLAVAPWSGDPKDRLDPLPPIIRSLRGEFPCIPFGAPEARPDLPPRWTQGVETGAAPVDAFLHGYSANHDWHLVDEAEGEITVAIDYPADHPVRRVERRIAAADGAGLTIDLAIEAARRVSIPVGVHPIFDLPGNPGAARLEIPSLRGVRTFPMPVEDSSILLPDQWAGSLAALATRDGGRVDFSTLPLGVPTEELLSVELGDGAVRLAFPDERYAIDLEWDINVFSQCLIWFSGRGRQAYPWCGRFQAIGIEPVRSAFDLGVEVSANAGSPFARAGIPTQLALDPGARFTTRYAIRLSGL